VTRERPVADRIAIVAAHNEAERIGATLDALARALPGARLMVADDASSDGTQETAMTHGAWVVSRGRPHGKGANVTATAQAAIDESGPDPAILLCDADLEWSAGRLVELIEAVERDECDLAVARFARSEGGGFGITHGYARRQIQQLCGYEADAPISGQRAMRLSTLQGLLPFADGFGLELGMTVDAVRAGYRLKEIELPLEHRAGGRTPTGFLHRARQLRDIRRAANDRRWIASPPR
jgi:glycosyltransferase involved in cell wall biosynthesis